MYASHSRASRPVSAGAALLVNGAIIAGLVFSAPDFIPKEREVTTVGKLIPLEKTDPPPPVEKTDPVRQVAQDHPIFIPDTPVRTETDTVALTGTDVIADREPTREVGTAEGTGTVTADPIPAVPPLIAAVIDPRYAAAFQPDYPASELRNDREGNVSVRVLIGADGRVKAVEQLRATSPAFFEATRRHALARWRFKPASRGGTPQESWKTMSVRFEITGG